MKAKAREQGRPAILCCIAVLAFGVSVGCAARQPGATARPWLKPPEQWTKADAEQVLTKSPWVRMRVKRFRYESGGTFPTFTEHCTPMNHPTDPHRVARDSCSYSYTPGTTGTVTAYEFAYEFVWESPEVVCHAQRLAPQGSDCEVDQDNHIIRVSGSVVPEETYMVLSSGRKILPSSITEGPAGTRIAFPARTPSGQPQIAANERSATLVTQTIEALGRVKIKFDLRKMVTTKGRDL